MAVPSEWALAYLEQARADMRGADLVQAEEPSVLAMLLQMVLEKLGKAALLRSGQTTVASATSSHAAATRMVQLLSNDRRACRRLDWQPMVLRAHLAPIVARLERAQPQLAAGGPCLEYPWEDPTGAVCWPARDLAIAKEFGPKRNTGPLLRRFVADLCARFDAVFPA